MDREIIVRNESTVSGSAFLYWQIPKQSGNDGIISLVWKRDVILPGQSKRFRWDGQPALTWCTTEIRQGGAEIDAYGVLPLSKCPGNRAVLRREGRAYLLVPDVNTSAVGLAEIYSDDSIPAGGVLAGLGFDGFPAIVSQFVPCETVKLPLENNVWICIADSPSVQLGREIPNPAYPRLATGLPARLDFPKNVDKLNVWFQKDNTWRIEPFFS